MGGEKEEGEKRNIKTEGEINGDRSGRKEGRTLRRENERHM